MSLRRFSQFLAGRFFTGAGRYALAVAAAGLGLAVRCALIPTLGYAGGWSVFYPAIVVVAWVGGFLPAIVASFLAAFGWLVVKWSAVGDSPQETVIWVRLLTFLVGSVVVSALGHAMHMALHREREKSRALQESEERFRLATEAMDGVIFDWDVPSDRVSRAGGLLVMTGHPEEEVEPTVEWWQTRVHKEDRSRLVQCYRDATARQAPSMECEYRIRHRDGRWLTLYDKSRIIYDCAGQATRVIGCSVDVTARRQAEAERARLQEQQRRDSEFRRSLIEHAPVGVAVVKGPEFHITLLNPAFQRIIGGDKSMLGRALAEVIPARAATDARELFRQAWEKGDAVQWRDYETRAPDGSTSWWDGEIIPIRDETGAVLSLLVFCWDITQRRQVELSARAAEESLRLALEAGSSGVFSWEVATNVNTWSDELLDLYGLAIEGFSGTFEAWLACLVPEDREPGASAVRNSLQTGSFEAQFRIRHRRTDEIRWMYGRGRVIYGKDGIPVRLVGINVDITRRKAAEAAMKESEERLRLALQAGHMGMWTCDVAGNSAHTDARASEIWGLPPRDEWRPLAEYAQQIHADDRSEALAVLTVGAESASSGLEFRIRRFSDGEERWIYAVGQPRRDSAGRVIEMAVINLDITARRLAQDALEQDARRKDEFIAMLGHELRNPLFAIANAVQVLKESDGNAADWAHAIVERQSATLTRLVDDLLDVARISRGRIELRKSVIDLRDVAARAIETVQPFMAERRHRLETSLGGDQRVLVEADATRLEQIVINLLTNAAKYTLPGGYIQVRVSGENGYALVSVEDNGVGIAPDVLPKLFELFTQAERSIDRADGGLGIGLNVCRQLVELHGGTIAGFSEGAGQGARFEVRLPLCRLDSAVAAPAASHGNAAAPGAASTGRRILLVDDNPDAARTLAHLLTRRGHRVELSHDGSAAIEIARSFQPEILLLDLGLPGIDGFELARQFRADATLGGALMVAVSGYTQESDRKRAMEAGFDRHFAKPVDLRALTDLIHAHTPPPIPSANGEGVSYLLQPAAAKESVVDTLKQG